VPAIAVADELRARGVEVSFLGARGRAEAELVPAAGYEIDFLRVRGLDRRNPLRAAGAAGLAAWAVVAARRALRRRGAEVVLGGGGYVAGTAGLAATLAGLPLVLTEADSRLGLANRLLARRAARVCLAFPIPGREHPLYTVTGRPVPAEVLSADRVAARQRFGIAEQTPCVLVVGGSLGALTLNRAALEAFAERPRSYHVIHLCGRRDHEALRAQLEALGPPPAYTLVDYEPRFGEALAASDLVVSRAGGSVFEIAAAGRASLLVPYPYATADHQTRNAAWLEEAGAAETIPDQALDPARLLAAVERLLADRALRERMARAARSLARPDAAARIADEVLKAVRA